LFFRASVERGKKDGKRDRRHFSFEKKRGKKRELIAWKEQEGEKKVVIWGKKKKKKVGLPPRV